MRSLRLQIWAGGAVTLLAASTGVPVLLAQLGGHQPTIGPTWLWWVLFGVFLPAYCASMWLVGLMPRRWQWTSFATQAALAPALVILAPAAGWVPVLLVLSAALSVYVVSRPVTGALVVVNTLAVTVTGWLNAADTFEVTFASLLYLMLQVVSVLAVATHQDDLASQKRLAEAHTELRATSALLADASRSSERLRIARDLHDVIGHQLTALALELEVASHHAEPPASEHVGRARSIAKELLSDVRGTVDHLRHESPELRATLEAVVADLPSPTVHLDVTEELQVDDATATALVRSVQEIVTNTIRHADALQLWIEVGVAEEGRSVRLRARDDGTGAKDLTLGNGLRGLRERVEALGGHATFRGDGGFAVTVEVPAR